VPRFRWIEWNLDKIATHGLSCEEVELGIAEVPDTFPPRPDRVR
jgi:hypothetical protein